MAAQHHRFFAIAILVKLGLVGTAWILDYSVPDGDLLQYGLIVLLALAMGLQNSTARVLAVADLTTTVLTLTLTGLAADSALAGGTSPRRNRRLLAIGAMFLGATIGALLALRAGTGSVLAVVFTLLALNAIWAYRIWSRATA